MGSPRTILPTISPGSPAVSKYDIVEWRSTFLGGKVTRETLDAVAVVAPDGLARDLVYPDQEDGVQLLPHEPRPSDADPADLAHLAGCVGHIAVALAGRVVLLDVRDAEPPHKLFPHVALEAVSKEALDAVVLVPRGLRRG